MTPVACTILTITSMVMGPATSLRSGQPMRMSSIAEKRYKSKNNSVMSFL